jgi:dTDP-4-amino-4,6-dideoxygalactose transaminase
MAVAVRQELAIKGGPRAITASARDQWQRPKEEERELVLQLLERGYSDSGKGMVGDLEDEFRAMTGADYCFATSHGHTALACAFYAAGVGPGDEFLTPVIGYIGTYAGALHMGARPVFVDIDPRTLLIDPADAERRITSRTRAISVIHLYGKVCDMDAFLDIGRRHNLTIIEDAAHAHGAEWDGKKIGAVGDVACFSFQGGPSPGGKPVAGGEGGALVTNNRELWERALIYGQLHRDGITEELSDPTYLALDREVLGWKFRAHPFAAALARVSLKTLPHRTERIWENWERFCETLAGIPGLEPVHAYPKAKPGGVYHAHQLLYHPQELGGLPAKTFVAAMRAEGAPMGGPELRARLPQLESDRAIFQDRFDLWGRGRGPLRDAWHGLPPYEPHKPGDFPVAESLVDKVITTPPYIEPSEGFLDQYLTALKKVTDNYGALL